MAAKVIDVPGDGAKNVDSRTAWKWLGIGRDTFEKLVEQHSSWLRPTRVGARVLWDCADIWILGRIMERSSENETTRARSGEE
jgi:hypothetical protein